MISEGKKTGGAIVLESSAMTPWKFAEWSNATAAKLAIADLGDLITGERSSMFEDPKPMFSWEIAIEVRVRDPASDASSLGGDLRSTMGGETGDTRPFSFAEWRKNEESPPMKGQANPLRDRDSEGKTFAYPTQTKRLTTAASEIAHDELTMKSIRGRGGSRFDGRAAAQQALAATPEGQALISQTRSDERKKIGGGKPDGKPDRGGPGKGPKGGPKAAVAEEDEVSGAAQISEAEAAVKRQSLCFECGLRGHIAANCPWATNFKKLRADCKAKQSDRANPAAEASNCWISDAGAEEANTEAGTGEELIEDWLAGAGGEHSLAAHVEEAEAPADVPAEAAPAASTAAVGEHRPLATHNQFAVLMLTSSGSDSDSDHVGEGPDSSDGGSDSDSDSDGEEGRYSSTPADLGGLPPIYGTTAGTGGASAQGPLTVQISMYLDDFLLAVRTEERSDAQDQGNVPCADVCSGFDTDGYAGGCETGFEECSPVVETCLSGTSSRVPRIMDSGCTSHSSGDPVNPLSDFCPGVEYISLGNAQYQVKSEGRGNLGPLRSVMWAPDMSYSMVSVSVLDTDGKLSLFGGGRCIVLSQRVRDMVLALIAEQPRSAMTASLRNRLYHMDDESAAPAVPPPIRPYVFSRDRSQIMGSQGTLRPGSTEGLNLLEDLRTGHSSKTTIMAGLKANAFRGAGATYEACRALEIRACDSCLRGGERQGHITRSSRDFSTLKPMQEVGLDPVKLSTTSIGGENYINFAHCYGTRLAAGVATKEEGNQVAVLKTVQRD
ncbi:hypothetical protein B484DRAFT_466165, partial [Ochromonadaceae sp. CCMP2298]